MYFSTIIEKGNKVGYHFIEAKEIQKISRERCCYVFYKVREREVFLPAFAIRFL